MAGLITDDLFHEAWSVLVEADVQAKIDHGAAVAECWAAGELSYASDAAAQALESPGRPERPLLVSLRDLPKRGLGTEAGRAALIHSIAHIEFNAINLAWDAIYRFRGMPGEYYADWIKVATEEAKHFQMLRQRLSEMDFRYGDFKAHNGLWVMANQTAGDPLQRMALVPRVLEARGLDVTPGMIKRLTDCGDMASVSILQVILHDEIGHVEIGTRWFRYLCDQRGLEPHSTFISLLAEHGFTELRPPVNVEARLQAGFEEEELNQLFPRSE